MHAKREETDEQFDQRHIANFKRADIDGWEIRKGMTDLHGLDLVPEPAIIVEALRGKKINFICKMHLWRVGPLLCYIYICS